MAAVRQCIKAEMAVVVVDVVVVKLFRTREGAQMFPPSFDLAGHSSLRTTANGTYTADAAAANMRLLHMT